MANESRGLGRGLGALLGAEIRPSASRGGGTLPVALMQPGAFQPRRVIEQQPLEELAASIKANGVIQPIVVRPLAGSASGAGAAASVGAPGAGGGARYEIVAGERRWQAAKLAGLSDIPAIVRELSDGQATAVALIENIQREELTAAEEARALQRLVAEFAWSHMQVAEAVGRSRAAVSNLIRLLDLPAEVVALIDTKRLSMGHARALLGLEEDAERVRIARLVTERGYSVRETERLVRQALDAKEHGAAAGPQKPDLAVVSEVLKTSAVRVQLSQKASGAARIVVELKDGKIKDEVIRAIRGAVER